jgi:hypothetical protein
MRLQPSTTVGRYVIEGELGRGGQAVVYRARHAQLGTAHAIKVLSVGSPSLTERLITEGRLQASLRHPNIVPVTDVIDVGGAPGLVMELVDGMSLDVLLKTRRLTLAQADAIAEGLMAGVAEAHRHGLVHRDLKPHNVMLQRTRTGLVPKVLDFGLAKVLGDRSAPGHETRTGATLGTPFYMAPEQVRDSKHVDPRADVWAIGCILYELLAGTRPFARADVLETYNAIAAGDCAPIRTACPDAPERCARAIDAALTVDLDRRAKDVETLLALWTDRAAAPADVWDADLLGGPAAAIAGSVGSPASGPAAASGTWDDGVGPIEPTASTLDELPAAPPDVAPPALPERRRWPIAVAAGLLVPVVLGGVWIAWPEPEPAPAPEPAPVAAPAPDLPLAVVEPFTPVGVSVDVADAVRTLVQRELAAGHRSRSIVRGLVGPGDPGVIVDLERLDPDTRAVLGRSSVESADADAIPGLAGAVDALWEPIAATVPPPEAVAARADAPLGRCVDAATGHPRVVIGFDVMASGTARFTRLDDRDRVDPALSACVSAALDGLLLPAGFEGPVERSFGRAAPASAPTPTAVLTVTVGTGDASGVAVLVDGRRLPACRGCTGSEAAHGAAIPAGTHDVACSGPAGADRPPLRVDATAGQRLDLVCFPIR